MLRHIITPIAAVAIFLASGISQAEAKRVKESAELFISFTLAPTGDQPEASGTAEIEVNRDKGQEETSFDFSVEGLADGSYVVNAEVGDEVVQITEFVVEPVVTDPETGEPVADDTSEGEGEIELPSGLDPLAISAITVVEPP